METVLVQINNNKAYKLLEDLEDLHIIKVLKKSIQTNQKLSEKYAGKLPTDIADELQNYVTQGRNEWNNRSI
jgi:L-cysteine desulfidase